jgi:hypothetical protein
MQKGNKTTQQNRAAPIIELGGTTDIFLRSPGATAL